MKFSFATVLALAAVAFAYPSVDNSGASSLVRVSRRENTVD